MIFRVWRSPLGLTAGRRCGVVAPAVVVAGVLPAAVLAGRPYLWLLTAGALAVCSIRAVVVWRGDRPVPATRETVVAESSWS
jgi:hypothetical protein